MLPLVRARGGDAVIGGRIPHEPIAPVYRYITSAPGAGVTPATIPRSSQGNPDSKGQRSSGRVIARWRIINRRVRVGERSVGQRRIINGNVNRFRIGRFDGDELLAAVGRVRFDYLLFFGLKGFLFQRDGAHSLDGVQDIRLLREKRVS